MRLNYFFDIRKIVWIEKFYENFKKREEKVE